MAISEPEAPYMTVDPGLSGTGLAVWVPDSDQPLLTKSLSLNSKLEHYKRSRSYKRLFAEFIDYETKGIEVCYIEWPRMFESAGGHMSSAKGDIHKLVFLVSCFANACWERGIEYRELPVNDWKGTMSKEMVAERVADRLLCDPKEYPNHVMDAVGMGLYVKGLLTIPEGLKVSLRPQGLND